MQSVVSTLRVLEAVATRQPAGVSELARSLQLPKTSVQRSLHVLSSTGWIRPVGSELRRWALTSKALHVGMHSAGDLTLREAAMPIMEELRQQTEETIHLMVPEGNQTVLVERLETPRPVRIILPLGSSSPIHASANGKAVLAARPPDEVQRVLASGLPRYTDTTITDPDELQTVLATTCDHGYATNIGEWRDDIAAVAAAILSKDGQPIASLSISTPINRMPTELRLHYGTLVHEAAHRISMALLSATNA